MPMSEERILRTELRWAAVSISVVSVILLVVIYAGIVHHINPPSNIETIDPNTLHLSGEFTEGNLDTRVAADGQVTSRIVATHRGTCLSRQSNEYVASQLRAFKSGARRNDIYTRMRSVASKLTEHEVDLLADFYAKTGSY